jgi:hypothetical protein
MLKEIYVKRLIGIAIAGMLAACGGSSGSGTGSPQTGGVQGVTVGGSNFAQAFMPDGTKADVVFATVTINTVTGTTTKTCTTTNALGSTIFEFAPTSSCPTPLIGGATQCGGQINSDGTVSALSVSLAPGNYCYVLRAYAADGATLIHAFTGAEAPQFTVGSVGPGVFNLGPTTTETGTQASAVIKTAGITGSEWFNWANASIPPGVQVTFTATAVPATATTTAAVTCANAANNLPATAVPATYTNNTAGDTCTVTFAAYTGTDPATAATLSVPMTVQNNVTQAPPLNVIPPRITSINFATTKLDTNSNPAEPVCTVHNGTGNQSCGFDYVLSTVASTATWAANTAYTLNQKVLSNGNVYNARVAGTSCNPNADPLHPAVCKGPGDLPNPLTLGIPDGTVIWDFVAPTYVAGQFTVDYDLMGVPFNAAIPPSVKIASSCDYLVGNPPKAATGSGFATGYGDSAALDIPVMWMEPTVQQMQINDATKTTTLCTFTVTVNNQGASDAMKMYVTFTQ